MFDGVMRITQLLRRILALSSHSVFAMAHAPESYFPPVYGVRDIMFHIWSYLPKVDRAVWRQCCKVSDSSFFLFLVDMTSIFLDVGSLDKRRPSLGDHFS